MIAFFSISSKRPAQEKRLLFTAVSFVPLQCSLELARVLLCHIGSVLLGTFTHQALISPLITYHLSIWLMCILFVYVVNWKKIWHSFCLPFMKTSFLFCSISEAQINAKLTWQSEVWGILMNEKHSFWILKNNLLIHIANQSICLVINQTVHFAIVGFYHLWSLADW